MNREEALSILTQAMQDYRSKPHNELSGLIGSPIILASPWIDGSEYQIEIEVFWDRPGDVGGNVRVLASIDDGGLLSSFNPLSIDFIKAPDGSFVGE